MNKLLRRRRIDQRQTPWEPQNPGQQPAPDVTGIRKNLATALQDSGCANFIKTLLNKVASKENPLVEGGDLLKVFDVITGPGQSGLVRGRFGGGAEVLGSVREGKGGIGFATLGGYPGRVGGEPLRQTLLWMDSINALHELIHLAGQDRYGDSLLAEALDDLNLPNTPKLERIPFPVGGSEAEIRDYVLHYSKYWNAELLKR